MNLKNRRIRCEISKTVQEKQFEPFAVSMCVEGDVPDDINLDLEFIEAEEFLEEKVFAAINRRMA